MLGSVEKSNRSTTWRTILLNCFYSLQQNGRQDSRSWNRFGHYLFLVRFTIFILCDLKHPPHTIKFSLSFSVGVFYGGQVRIIANDQGNRTTPSHVAFTDTERLIGDAAKNQIAMNPNNSVFDAKRLIGRRFEDTVVQADMKHWPFDVVSDGGKCFFKCYSLKP